MSEDVRRQPNGEKFIKLGPIKRRSPAGPSLVCFRAAQAFSQTAVDLSVPCILHAHASEAENQVSDGCTRASEHPGAGTVDGHLASMGPKLSQYYSHSCPALLCLLRVAETEFKSQKHMLPGLKEPLPIANTWPSNA